VPPSAPPPTTDQVQAWSVEQVRDWAQAVVGHKHASVLEKQEISGDQLLKVTKEELERCGIPMGPAGKLMDAIKLLSQSAGVCAPRLWRMRCSCDCACCHLAREVDASCVPCQHLHLVVLPLFVTTHPSTFRSVRAFHAASVVVDPRLSFKFAFPSDLGGSGPSSKRLSPAETSDDAVRLLCDNTFLDKSNILHTMLTDFYVSSEGDFRLVPLALVYPRRFAKTTLLGLIDAVFSPLPIIQGEAFDVVKGKVAALRKGPELLAMGMHPVVRLNMISVRTRTDLHDAVTLALVAAELSRDITSPKLGESPAAQLKRGVCALNEQFKTELGKTTRTIVTVDEYDKPFRDEKPDQELLASLKDVYGLGKDSSSGISLLCLAG
jgi:hypothetical protein